ncbi:hypothetical protein AKO1_014646, partial [Acrasis kona]
MSGLFSSAATSDDLPRRASNVNLPPILSSETPQQNIPSLDYVYQQQQYKNKLLTPKMTQPNSPATPQTPSTIAANNIATMYITDRNNLTASSPSTSSPVHIDDKAQLYRKINIEQIRQDEQLKSMHTQIEQQKIWLNNLRSMLGLVQESLVDNNLAKVESNQEKMALPTNLNLDAFDVSNEVNMNVNSFREQSHQYVPSNGMHTNMDQKYFQQQHQHSLQPQQQVARNGYYYAENPQMIHQQQQQQQQQIQQIQIQQQQLQQQIDYRYNLQTSMQHPGMYRPVQQTQPIQQQTQPLQITQVQRSLYVNQPQQQQQYQEQQSASYPPFAQSPPLVVRSFINETNVEMKSFEKLTEQLEKQKRVSVPPGPLQVSMNVGVVGDERTLVCRGPIKRKNNRPKEYDKLMTK